MKDLKLKENEVVHCKTKKQAKKVLKSAKKLGVKNTEGFIEKWSDEKKNTCYRFNKGFFGILYSSRVFYESSGDEIITAKEFLKRHKKSKTDKLEDRFVYYSKQVKEVLEGFKDLIVEQRKDIDNLIKQQSIILESDFKEDTSEVKSDIPKVGDIVKAWSSNRSDNFIYGKLEYVDRGDLPYLVSGNWNKTIEKAPEEITKYFK